MGASGQPAQAEEPEVRVGRLGEPVEQERHQLVHQARCPGEALGQFEDGGTRAPGVREAKRRQSLAYQAVAPEPCFCRRCTENLQQGAEK